MNKDINTKRDAHATVMQPAAEEVREYTFPTLGVAVKATSYAEALELAKKKFKSNK